VAFPNLSDIMATTISNRSRKIADNVTKNNAILKQLEMKGKVKPFSGGVNITQELSFAENSNAGWYSGYDILPVGVSDVISAAEYPIKQAAVPVVISGLEQLQNASKERMIDLMDGRMTVAESTISNLVAGGLYSDGTGAGGKEIEGLDLAIPTDPTAAAAPYGGIDGSVFTFWQNQIKTGTLGPTTIQADWNGLWASLQRGMDRPDLIMVDSTVWEAYVASLQSLQRFTGTETGKLGFPSIKYMDADVILDGGIGGFCPAGTAFFLNCDYLFYRPHSARNMVPLSPNRRYATNQDAEVQILAWAGNLATSGRQFQGRYTGS
jgi:hypothetical protein